jgi:hypothetical protein
MRTHGLLLLAVCVLVFAGCTKTVHMTFINNSTENVQLSVEGDHEGEERVGYVPPGDRRGWDLVIDADELPEDFTIEVSDADSGNERERAFTVSDKTPWRLWVQITESGDIAGPSTDRK